MNNDIKMSSIKYIKTESEMMSEIFDIIDNSEYVELYSFLNLISKKGLWTCYRKNSKIIEQYVNVHNFMYYSSTS